MDLFLQFYDGIYTKDDLQLYVAAGFLTQAEVDARIAEVEAAKSAN